MAAAAMAMSLATGGAQAALVLDQSHTGGHSPFNYHIHGTFFEDEDQSGSIAQSFAVGVTGRLDRIEVYASHALFPPTDSLVLEVQSLAGGLPGGSILASASLSPAAVTTGFGYNAFDISGANLLVTAGDLLAFVLRSDSELEADFFVPAFVSGVYGAGQAFWRETNFFNPSAPWQGLSGRDLRFNTYVEDFDAGAVPEPASLSLLGAALIVVTWCRRRRRV
jgi:hypothetical protein